MIDALLSGKLIKDCQLKASQNDKVYTNFLISVSVGDAENTVISGIAFGATAERIALLKKGDAVAVTGALKPTEWDDKAAALAVYAKQRDDNRAFEEAAKIRLYSIRRIGEILQEIEPKNGVRTDLEPNTASGTMLTRQQAAQEAGNR